jgi:hypothetical protein
MMEIQVRRFAFKESYTIGRMSIDNEFFCNTLEDVVRDLKDYDHDGKWDNKIYGETAIPCGRYQVVVTYSPKFGKRLPELLSVPGFMNIRIHAGADAKHTEGCILVGENKQKGRLINGGYYQNKLVEMIDDQDRVFITIKE